MRRGSKPVRSVCARSGIECWLHDMVPDGYIKGIYVLPEYYEPPQPFKYKLPAEVPAYNPQPLNDTWAAVVDFTNLYRLSHLSDAVNPPYSYVECGKFSFAVDFRFTASGRNDPVQAFINLGQIGIMPPSVIELVGVSSSIVLGKLQLIATHSPFGSGGWGAGPWQAKSPGMAWGQGTYSQNPWAGFITNIEYSEGTWGAGAWRAKPIAPYSYSQFTYSYNRWSGS